MAQIDSRIALGFHPTTQLESPVNNLARILQVQGAQQANQMNAMKMAEAQAAGERRNKLAALLQGQYETPEAREDALLRGGFMDEAQNLAKGRGDARKASADAQSKEFEVARERLGLIYNAASGAKDQASYQMALQGLQAAGIDISNIPAQYDPAYVESAKTQALTEAQRLEQMWKGKDFDLNVRKQSETERNNQTQNRISQGQLGVAQGNLGLRRRELDLQTGNAVADAGGPSQAGLTKQFGKAPPGYRWKPDGTAEAIPGGPADIKAGEAGAKAQGRRDAAALAAGNVLSAVTDAKNLVGVTTTGPGSLLSKVPGTNARDLQAKLDTVKANLGFDRLQQMREMSPTGGALGAVAVQELIALQSTVASLDQAQSPTELRKSLEKIERHYNKWLQTVNQSAGTPAPTGQGASNIDALLEKYK